MKVLRWFKVPARAVQNVLLAAVIATLSIFLTAKDEHYVSYFAPFYSMERTGYDLLFTLRGQRLDRVDPRIVIVGFDHQDEMSLGNEKDGPVEWPVPRRYHADVLRNLKKDGAALIVYDVLFSGHSDASDDKALNDALGQAGNVVLSMRLDRDYNLMRETLEEPYHNDTDIDFLPPDGPNVEGLAEVSPDGDGVVRRFTPFMYFQDQAIPSMAAAAYLKLANLKQDNLALKKDALQIGDVLIPRSGPSQQDRLHAKYIIGSAYMDFPAGNNAFPQDTPSFSQVVQNKFVKGYFKGKIVFVGLTGSLMAHEDFDQFVTAYTSHTPDARGSLGFVNNIPGVYLQAMNFNAILHGGFVKKFPLFGLWILVFGLSIAGAVSVRSTFNWRGPAVLILCTIIYIVYAIQVFSHFMIYVPWIVPSVLMFFSISLVTYFERGALRKKWAGYVSPQVLETILKGASEDVAAQRYKASVVFGDIRGFTSFTTKHSPETVVQLLNMHFERMTKIIYEEQGTIDKFFGDGVMVLFGAPVPLEDAAIRAVRAAWRMCQASKEPLELNGEAYVLDSGFGVTTGDLVAGHVGSKQRHDYTVIGEVVNLSSRLQGVTGAADVVIDSATLELVKGIADVMPLGEVYIKGLSEHLACFRVIGWTDQQKGRRRKQKPAPVAKTGISE